MAARRVTDVLQPRNVLLAGMPAVGALAAGHWTGLLWGLLGALCAGIVPAAYIEWERGRGRWGDRHVVDRTQRAPIFLVILGSIGTGSLLMVAGGAPVGILSGTTPSSTRACATCGRPTEPSPAMAATRSQV
ncbi:hypothetical protein AB0R11_20425, partial [Streptomyces fradiae]